MLVSFIRRVVYWSTLKSQLKVACLNRLAYFSICLVFHIKHFFARAVFLQIANLRFFANFHN